jgi:hypothetical protein
MNPQEILNRKIVLKEQAKTLLLDQIRILDLQIEDLRAQSSRSRTVWESSEEKKAALGIEVGLG